MYVYTRVCIHVLNIIEYIAGIEMSWLISDDGLKKVRGAVHHATVKA